MTLPGSFRDTYVMITNNGIDVTFDESELQPLFNFIALKINASDDGNELDSIEGRYQYGQGENEAILLQMDSLHHLPDYIDGEGSLKEKVLAFTHHWENQEITSLFSNLVLPSLESEGVSRQQLILDVFAVSLGIYLSFCNFNRDHKFKQFTPLTFSFPFEEGDNPLSGKTFKRFSLPARLSTVLCKNQMGVNLSLALTNAINIWGPLFRSEELFALGEVDVNEETNKALEEHLLTQAEQIRASCDNFERLGQQLSEQVEQFRQKLDGSVETVTMMLMDKVTNGIETQVKSNLSALTKEAEVKVAEKTLQKFHHFFSESLRNYDPVLKDVTERKVQKCLGEAKDALDKKVDEARFLLKQCEKLYEDIKLALTELRGIPSDVMEIKQRLEYSPQIEDRISALELQYSRLLNHLS